MTLMDGNCYQCLRLSDNYIDYVIGSKLIWILFLRAYDWKHITGQGWKTTPECKSLYRVCISFILASSEIFTGFINILDIISKTEKIRNTSDYIESSRSVNWEI